MQKKSVWQERKSYLLESNEARVNLDALHKYLVYKENQKSGHDVS